MTTLFIGLISRALNRVPPYMHTQTTGVLGEENGSFKGSK
jgi:hypothetical protein